MLELRPEDMLLYSAKMIPGNEKRVIRLMNQARSPTQPSESKTLQDPPFGQQWSRVSPHKMIQPPD